MKNNIKRYNKGGIYYLCLNLPWLLDRQRILSNKGHPVLTEEGSSQPERGLSQIGRGSLHTDSGLPQADSGPLQANRGFNQIGKETLRPTEGLLASLSQQRVIPGQHPQVFHISGQALRQTYGVLWSYVLWSYTQSYGANRGYRQVVRDQLRRADGLARST